MQLTNKHFEGSCELLRFDADKLFMIYKLFANFVQNVCKHGHSDKNTFFCSSRAAFVASSNLGVHKNSSLFKCTQNQFTKYIQNGLVINGMYME